MVPKLVALLGMLVMLGACTNAGTRADGGGEGVVVEAQVRDSKMHEASGDPNEMVCRRTHQVGSNFPRTVCKTRREMDEERRDAERAMQLQQQRNAAGRIDPARGG